MKRMLGVGVMIAASMAVTACSLLPALPAPTPSAIASASSTDDISLGLTRYSPEDRKPVTGVTGTTLDGKQLDISSLRGRVVVINAWASWCDPCQEELPVLVSVANSSDPKSVSLVGLDVNDTLDAANAMVKKFAIPYPSIIDKGARLLVHVPGVPPEAIPSTVVLDRQGRVAARVIGTVKPGMLEPVIAELQAE